MNSIYLAPVIDAYRGGDKKQEATPFIQKEGEREPKSLERKLKEHYIPKVDFPKI